MADILVELVAKIRADATELKHGLDQSTRSVEAWVKENKAQFTTVGIALTGIGAVVTGSLGMMTKASIDEEVGIKRLGVALRGVGLNYDDVKGSLESVIATTQRKTGIADNEQRDILGRLILVTKDYNKALGLLPLTLDVAAASGMNASSAATYLAKAYEELEGGAEKVGIRMGTTTVYFKDLAEIQSLVGGTALAAVNPFNVLKNSITDLAEVIGIIFVPALTDTIAHISDITEGIGRWVKVHPELAQKIALTVGALGILAGALGSVLLILPRLLEGYIALNAILSTTLIPMIVRFTVALWAQVTATLAALASTGLLIPAAIAAVVAIGSITFAISQLVAQQQSQIGVTSEVITAQSEQIESTNKLTDSFNAQAGVFPQLNAGVQSYDSTLNSLGNTIERVGKTAKDTFIRIGHYMASANISFPGGIPEWVFTERYGPEWATLPTNLAEARAREAAMEEYQFRQRLTNWPEFQHGGIVTQPTIGLIGEAGPEAVIPLEKMGNVIINFTQPVFFDREESMNAFVDMIRKGIQRQDRLRFGGAYSG